MGSTRSSSSRRVPTRSGFSPSWSLRAPVSRASSFRKRRSTRSSSTWSVRMPAMRSVESSMRKIWAVVRREFVERVRRRWFWIMALVGPLFFGAVFVLPSVLARGGGVRQIVVVDGTAGPLGRRITDSLNATRAFDAVFVRAGGRVLDSLTTEVEEKRLSGFLILTAATVDSGKAEYRGSNVSRSEERRVGKECRSGWGATRS